MPKKDQPYPVVADGFEEMAAGMHSGMVPTALESNQASKLWNVSLRGDYTTHRPPFRHITDFCFRPGLEGPVESTCDGIFQGAFFYRNQDNRTILLMAIGDWLYDVDFSETSSGGLSKFAMRRVGVPGETDKDGKQAPPFNPDTRQVWFEQGEEYCVIQDGSRQPIIYRSKTVRRANVGVTGPLELPAGRAMLYANGRMWVGLPDGQSFVASDIARGSSGTPSNGYTDAILKMSENQFLSEGGSFAVPSSGGNITAFVSPAQQDLAPDTGKIVAFTKGGAYFVNLPIDRTEWKELRFPIISTAQVNRGCIGPRAFALVNGDIVYRADDGIRSFAMARRSFESSWVNGIISEEMSAIHEEEQKTLLGSCSAVYWDGRVLVTCNPRRIANRGVVFDGIMSLAMDRVSSITSRDTPAWEGTWGGLAVYQILAADLDGRYRCFAIAERQNYLALYEIDSGQHFELTSGKTEHPVLWTIETRALFSDERSVLKKLYDFRLWLSDIRGPAVVKLLWRPFGTVQWVEWGTRTANAASSACIKSDGCTLFANTVVQARSPMIWGDPPDDICFTSNKTPANYGHAFQLRLEIYGSCRITMGILRAWKYPFEEPVECEEEIEVVEYACNDSVERTYKIA
jgi:hypothetical protein